MDAELRRRLGELYAPDVEALGRHVGRDLGGWVSTRPRVAA
jgi:hypothetical protein